MAPRRWCEPNLCDLEIVPFVWVEILQPYGGLPKSTPTINIGRHRKEREDWVFFLVRWEGASSDRITASVSKIQISKTMPPTVRISKHPHH